MTKILFLLSFFLFHSFCIQAEPPSIGIGYFLNQTIKTDAFCLDGSGPLYYYFPGIDSGSAKWYIHFEGGGWCTNHSDCFARSQTRLGSTLQDPPTIDISANTDYFSIIYSQNPLMFNWNKVYIRYCDGGSFSGDNLGFYQNSPLFYKGKKILDAVFTDLLLNREIGSATDVVVSGASAGALSSILHGDYVKTLLGEGKKVVLMPDSGFFLDFVGMNVDYHSDMRWVFENMNSRGGVNQKCVEFYGINDWKCFFAEHALPFVESPVFVLQPKFDSWQIDNVLGTNDKGVVNDFGKELMRRLNETFLSFEKNSGFVDSCYHHCGLWNTIHINNLTQSQAFGMWYNGVETKAVVRDDTYVCDECCV